MARRTFSSPSGLTLYVVLTRPSDGYVWQTTTSTAVPFVAANIANYDIALSPGETSQDFYYYIIPSALPGGTWVDTVYELAGVTPSITDEILDPGRDFGWNGVSITVPTPISGVATVGDLRNILARVARFAGGNSANATGQYNTFDADTALQVALSDFIRRTHCTRKTDTFTVTEDAPGVDLSGITGFHTERILEVFINSDTASEVSNLRVVSYSDIIEDTCGASGTPDRIGFYNTSGEGKLRKIPNFSGDGTVRWWPDLTAWTIGDDDAGDLAVNIPGDLARGIAATGAVCVLQAGALEAVSITNPLRVAYEALCQRSMGTGNEGVKSIQRVSLSTRRRY